MVNPFRTDLGDIDWGAIVLALTLLAALVMLGLTLATLPPVRACATALECLL